jgi:hypothetical protein
MPRSLTPASRHTGSIGVVVVFPLFPPLLSTSVRPQRFILHASDSSFLDSVPRFLLIPIPACLGLRTTWPTFRCPDVATFRPTRVYSIIVLAVHRMSLCSGSFADGLISSGLSRIKHLETSGAREPSHQDQIPDPSANPPQTPDARNLPPPPTLALVLEDVEERQLTSAAGVWTGSAQSTKPRQVLSNNRSQAVGRCGQLGSERRLDTLNYLHLTALPSTWLPPVTIHSCSDLGWAIPSFALGHSQLCGDPSRLSIVCSSGQMGPRR